MKLTGLFKSIYGRTDQGIFPELYSHHGSSSAVKRMDIRLAGYPFGQVEEDEEDDEDEEEEKTVDKAPVQGPQPSPSPARLELPTAPGGSVRGPSVFATEKEGFPMWLVGIFILGFALAWRQRKKATSA